jgi:hypothetical protein
MTMALRPSPPQAIILAGFDYHGGGVDFLGIARNRQARLIAKDPQLTVTIMDVGTGTTSISAAEPDAKGRLVRTVTTAKTHSPVTAKNYSTGLGHHTRFDTDPAGRMSITDVYAAVQAVGADWYTRGKLVEVSIFSHGFWDGAILVNGDDTQPGKPERDPDDKDARVTKDFRSPNMTTAQLASFRAAFAPGALWWNWGCAFTESYRQVTHRFINSLIYRKTAPGKLKDTDKVKFNFPADMAEDIYGDDTIFFPQTTRITSSGDTVFKDLVFERTVKEVKDFFLRGVRDSYHMAVAKASGVPTRGAFLGTYADYEENDKRIKLPLMNIPRSAKIYGTDFTSYITMWVKVLKFSTDPENHGYGIFPP